MGSIPPAEDLQGPQRTLPSTVAPWGRKDLPDARQGNGALKVILTQ